MAVDSQNVVGYTTLAVNAGEFYMIGAQYEDVGGGAIAIQDLVKGDFQGVNYGDGESFKGTAPALQVWTPSGYQLYYYLNDAYISEQEMPKGWADALGNYTFETVEAGQAGWFKSPSNATLVTAGQVIGSAAGFAATKDTFFMFSVPFPAATPINSESTVWSGLKGVDYGDGESFKGTAPALQVWTPSGYQLYYYLNDAYISEQEMPKGWADALGNYVNGNFPVGSAFWFKAATDVEATFASPIAE